MKQFTRFNSYHRAMNLWLKLKQKLLFFLFLFASALVHGQAVSWELSAQPGDQANNFPTVQGADFDFCNLTRSPSIETALGAGSMNSDLWFEDGTPTTLAWAIAENRYYEFTISTTNCLFFNPTTIKIVIESSDDGPNTATLRSSSDGFTTNIGTVSVETSPDVFTFSESISPTSQSITYRLYGYGGAADGGTPSPDGTMRIGSSQTAADNDLEFFASTTFINVTAVTDIIVTSGDFVPASVFTSNVPGATFDWSRTPESIGLGLTSGTGNIPAFTSVNNTASPVTSTVTVHANAGTCSSVDEIYSITVNPAVCTITVEFFGDPSPCNDNGTPNDPGDDFFTQNIHANFLNRPFTGSLQIVPGGDAIGNYSIPVQNINGNQHLFTSVQLKADGTPSNVQMNFTDAPTCIDAATGPSIAPCSTPVTCSITDIILSNVESCNNNGTADPADDYFIADVTVEFIGQPSTGTLEIFGNDLVLGVFSVVVANLSGTSFAFSNVQFKADGGTTNIGARFSDNINCVTSVGTFISVQPCSSTPPIINCPLPLTVSCTSKIPATNPSTVTESHDCPGGVTIIHVGDVITNQTCANRYTLARTYQVTDQCGHSVTCTQIITVNDQDPPLITCPASTTLGCNGVAQFGQATAGDECGNATVAEVSTIVTHGLDGSHINTRTWRATDACGNTSICSQSITVPICEQHCSNGQGYYGNQNGQSCTGLTAAQSINLALQGGPIVAGCNTKTVTIYPGEATCLASKMPGGTTPAVLPSGNAACSTATGNSYLKQGRFKSVLLAQTLALSLNIRLDNTLGTLQITNNYFSTYAATSCTNGASVSGTKQVFYIPQSVRNCIGANGTVNDLLSLANKALGGGTGSCALPNACTASLGDITQALDAINRGFNKCRILGDFAGTSAGTRIANEVVPGFEIGVAMNVYPNPFSQNATVEFTASESEDASIELFDISGSRIAEIFHGYVEQDEVYQVQIDANNLAEGIYLCRYASSNFSTTIRVVIMK